MNRQHQPTPQGPDSFRSRAFWKWLGKGLGGAPGWGNLADRWLILHVLVGIIFGLASPIKVSAMAGLVLLPLTGIMIGVALAWAGNIYSIVQTTELHQLGEGHRNGIEHYIYSFQLGVLTLLVTASYWGIAAIGIFDLISPWGWMRGLEWPARCIGLTLTSIALRESWGLVNLAGHLLRSKALIEKME